MSSKIILSLIIIPSFRRMVNSLTFYVRLQLYSPPVSKAITYAIQILRLADCQGSFASQPFQPWRL